MRTDAVSLSILNIAAIQWSMADTKWGPAPMPVSGKTPVVSVEAAQDLLLEKE